MNDEPDSHRPQKTASQDKVPAREKILSGLGGPSLGLAGQVVEYQVQQVLVYGLGMSPVLKGIIVIIFSIWGAFIDPVMGWISENTRTRYGRCRPSMFFRCILMALFLPFVWRFNEGWDMTWIAVWFITFGIIMSTVGSVYNIPYQTLKMEMTPDYNERTSVNVYAGIIAGLWTVVPSMKADIVDDDEARTGERREGSFESMFSWFLKATGTIFTGISGLVVVAAGFDIDLGTHQADGVFTRMILLMSLIPMVLGTVQCILIMKWPLSAGRMEEIRETLEERRGKINMSGGGIAD